MTSPVDTDEERYIPTAGYEKVAEEIPDRLRNHVVEHLEAIRQILIQVKKKGQWKTIRERVRGVAGMDVDVVCSDLVRMVKAHAEGAEGDRDYRAKIECHGQDNIPYYKFAPIKVSVGADGGLEVEDSSDSEDRQHMVLIKDILDTGRLREKEMAEQHRLQVVALFDKLIDQSDRAFTRNEAMAKANGENAAKVGELVGQYTAIGGALQDMMVGVTSMLTVGVELHSSHAEKNAEVQIAQLDMEADQAKWGAGIGLLSKVLGPLGEQIAKTVGGKSKKKQLAPPTAAPPTVSQAADEAGEPAQAAAATGAEALPPAQPVEVTKEWAAGKTQEVSAFLEKMDERCRDGIKKMLAPSALEFLEESLADGFTDEATAQNLVLIRQNIEQRVQDNPDVMAMLLAKLNGVLGDDLTKELMDLLPDPDTDTDTESEDP